MVYFYHRKRSNSSYLIDWVDEKTGRDGFSYMMFHLVRSRLWSLFNPTAGCVWLNWPLADHDGKCFEDGLRKFVLDIATWCPKVCWPMFVQYDCEGNLTSSQCRKIMQHLSRFDLDGEIEKVCIMKINYNGENVSVDNVIVNDERTKHWTRYYVGGIRHAAENGLAFCWN